MRIYVEIKSDPTKRRHFDLTMLAVLGLFMGVAAGCGGGSQPPGQNPPAAAAPGAPLASTPLTGLPSGPSCGDAVGTPGADCLVANCVLQDGKRIVSLQWKRDAACVVSTDKTILQNVVRFRKSGGEWSMSNYVAIPDASTAMSFSQPFEPGSYELSVKLRPNSEKDVVMTVK